MLRPGIIPETVWNLFVDTVKTFRLSPGVGYRIKTIFGIGTTLEILPGNGGGGDSDHPFKVTLREKADSPGEFEGKVSLNSILLKSLSPADKQTITGLNTWFDVILEDVIWLELTISAGAITAAAIKSLGNGDSGFDPSIIPPYISGSYVEDDGAGTPAQNVARALIAWTRAELGSDFLAQSCETHLMMSRIFCSQGIGTIFPYPSPYGAF